MNFFGHFASFQVVLNRKLFLPNLLYISLLIICNKSKIRQNRIPVGKLPISIFIQTERIKKKRKKLGFGFDCQRRKSQDFFQVSDFNLSPLFCLLFQNDAKKQHLRNSIKTRASLSYIFKLGI